MSIETGIRLVPTSETVAPDWLDRVTRLRRGPGRNMVHRAGCRYAPLDKSLPWLWAEDKSTEEIAAAARSGLKFCRVCNPVSL